MNALTEPCFIPACGLGENHDGRHRSVENADRCRVAPDGKTCSRKGCRQTAVLQLNRRRRLRDGTYRDAWWSYCPDHNYGRIIEGGRVFFEWRTDT